MGPSYRLSGTQIPGHVLLLTLRPLSRVWDLRKYPDARFQFAGAPGENGGVRTCVNSCVLARWTLPTASERIGPPLPRSLRNLLDGEMEHSAALRQEVDALKKKVAEQEERHVTKVQALAR